MELSLSVMLSYRIMSTSCTHGMRVVVVVANDECFAFLGL